MSEKMWTVLRVASIITSIASAVTGFAIDRKDARDLGDKLQEMKNIQENIRNLSKK